METERAEFRCAVRHGYQILLRVEAQIELPTDLSRIRDFYRSLVDTCLDWAKNDYGEQLKAEYAALTSVRERAQFRPQKYSLGLRLCHEEAGLAAFVCESVMTGAWRGMVDGYHRVSHVWDTSEETALPMGQILNRFGFRLSKKDLPFCPDGIYPEKGDLVVFRNATESDEFLEKKFSLQNSP